MKYGTLCACLMVVLALVGGAAPSAMARVEPDPQDDLTVYLIENPPGCSQRADYSFAHPLNNGSELVVIIENSNEEVWYRVDFSAAGGNGPGGPSYCYDPAGVACQTLKPCECGFSSGGGDHHVAPYPNHDPGCAPDCDYLSLGCTYTLGCLPGCPGDPNTGCDNAPYDPNDPGAVNVCETSSAFCTEFDGTTVTVTHWKSGRSWIPFNPPVVMLDDQILGEIREGIKQRSIRLTNVCEHLP